ncbi:ABC transporter substrate-binding protein [Nocardioides sp.]|uniref:ABC transporter substrate-binding protein n=1 Tax=Nocardioides sp. TaxID=35761 RepID=UPI002ED3F0E6
MNPTRRSVLAGLATLAVMPAVAACGSDQPGSATPSTPAPEGAEEGAFPVTIAHKFGETTLETAPERVVCVGLTDQDTLLALGIVPVGVSYWFGEKSKRGIYSWAEEAFGDAEPPTLLMNTNGVEIEQVAALQPDLIIGQYAGLTEKEYELLSKIAPTVAQSGDYADYGTPWDEAALTIGTAVGRPAATQKLIDGVKERIVAEAKAHPEFAGQTAAVVTPYEGLFIYGPEDPRSRLLVELGFDLPPIITDATDSEFGISLSAERTSDLAAVGAVVWLDLDADKQVRTVFEGTTAHEQGRWFDITNADGDYYVAHSFVTPLSIPYVLDRYVPQLAAAADGDPATEVPSADEAARG